MKAVILIAILSFVTIGCNNANPLKEFHPGNNSTTKVDSVRYSQAPPIAWKIAEAHGIENWNGISEIGFTFNVDRNGSHFWRSWTWKPKTGDIQMISTTDTVRYNRSRMDSLTMKTDAAFINDKYWLLTPFQLVWDQGMDFSERENAMAPISKDTLNLLTVVYPNVGGYTPGDAYDFFYDKNFRIKEWNYRKGNAADPNTTTTWEEYKNFDGIDIATMHQNGEKDFKLYFTDISIKK